MKNKKIAIVFGKLLRKLRKKRALSQEELSFNSGVNRGFLSMLEQGNQSPSFEKVVDLCEALNIPLGHFASIFAEELKDFSDKTEEQDKQKI